VLNYGVSLLMTLVVTLTAFLSTPLLLGWLGEQRFGAYRAAQDWAGYLGLLELGLGGALTALLAQAVGRADPVGVWDCLKAGVRAYLRVTGLMAAAGVVLAVVLPVLVPVSDELRTDLWFGFLLSMSALTLLPLTPFRLLAEASQRSYLVNALTAVQSLLTVGMSLAAAWAGWGLTGQFLAVVLGSTPLPLALTWMALRRGFTRPAAPPSAGGAAEAERRLWNLNTPTLVHNLCGRLSLFTDNILIALVLGPAAVAPFYLTQRVLVLAQTQLQNISGATWAGLIELSASGQRERFVQRLSELTRLTATLSVAVLVPLAVCNGALISLWVGAGRYAGEALTWCVAANAFFLSIYSLWGWVFNGAGKVRLLLPLMTSGVVLNVAVSVGATFLLGPVGPVLGTLLMYLYNAWRFPPLLRAAFGVPLRPLLQPIGWVLLLAVPYAALCLPCAQAMAERKWLHLGAHALLAAAAFAGAAWLVVFSRQERNQWRSRLSSLFPDPRSGGAGRDFASSKPTPQPRSEVSYDSRN
jgi:O-antigen/teichoic acid export membrane protein